jgi:ribosomal protein L22
MSEEPKRGVEGDEATGPRATGDEAAEEAPSRRRRSAETATAAPKKAPAPRAADGTVVVRAQAKYVRHAPRKARLVVDHIRGKSIDEARAILNNTPRAAAREVLKLLESAVANAENNHELVADDLVIREAYVDEGPTLKRYRPRALGRATRIRKRTSHMTIQLSPKE